MQKKLVPEEVVDGKFAGLCDCFMARNKKGDVHLHPNNKEKKSSLLKRLLKRQMEFHKFTDVNVATRWCLRHSELTFEGILQPSV